jgi:hypothetical protein
VFASLSVRCDVVRAQSDSAATRECVARAVSLLDDGPNAAERLEQCWEQRDGTRSLVGTLKRAFNVLLREYLDSGDVSEAERCLRELAVPDYHFAFVKEAVWMVADRERDASRVAALLTALTNAGILSGGRCREDACVLLSDWFRTYSTIARRRIESGD